ncbi:hypothetical protein RI129_006174 [Pyrocoelia pectoralis]|uniref:Complex 1 LYR protein domain-containing protein n=1 Tax=Pyrocoelia pectoralis TaxID=417401 RepID=A0AAN7VEU9_9COLE
MQPSPKDILKLYKNLLRYGQELQYTDKHYFCKRIKNEFQQNRSLTDITEIQFNYKRGVSLLEKKTVV